MKRGCDCECSGGGEQRVTSCSFHYGAMECGGRLGAAFELVVAPLAGRVAALRRACRNPPAAERMKNRSQPLTLKASTPLNRSVAFLHAHFPPWDKSLRSDPSASLPPPSGRSVSSRRAVRCLTATGWTARPNPRASDLSECNQSINLLLYTTYVRGARLLSHF
jgi:hypothetical protein